MKAKFFEFEEKEQSDSLVLRVVFYFSVAFSIISIFAFVFSATISSISYHIHVYSYNPYIFCLFLQAPLFVSAFFYKSPSKKKNVTAFILVSFVLFLHILLGLQFVFFFNPSVATSYATENNAVIILDMCMVVASYILYIITRIRSLNMSILVIASVIICCGLASTAILLYNAHLKDPLVLPIFTIWLSPLFLIPIGLSWFSYIRSVKNKALVPNT